MLSAMHDSFLDLDIEIYAVFSNLVTNHINDNDGARATDPRATVHHNSAFLKNQTLNPKYCLKNEINDL